MLSRAFSVVIPVKFAHPYIEKTLDSIIIQSDLIEEVLIVSDNAKDEVIKRYKTYLNISLLSNRYKVVYSDGKGPGSARDFGARLSKSKYIAFIDSDDIWPASYLSNRLQHLIKSKYLFTASPYDHVDDKLRKLPMNFKCKNRLTSKDFILLNPIGNSTVIVDRIFFIESGGYSKLKKRNDYATWMRLVKRECCNYIKDIEPVVIIRREGALSKSKFKLLKYQFLAYKEANYNNISAFIFCTMSSFMGAIKYFIRGGK